MADPAGSPAGFPSRAPLWPGEGGTALIHVRPIGGGGPPRPRILDALADPVDADLAPSLYAMLPQGAAWRTPDAAAFDANSRLGGLLRGFSGVLAATYRRLFGIALESTATTLVASLDDWEVDFGLPDPCLGDNPGRDARMASLVAKIRSKGTITPADFVALAASVGHDVTIDEPLPWRCGRSRCGQAAERLGGGLAVEFYWIVRPGATTVIPFRAGRARAGMTPLGEVQRLQDLECLFRAVAPAWTQPVFNYA